MTQETLDKAHEIWEMILRRRDDIGRMEKILFISTHPCDRVATPEEATTYNLGQGGNE